MKAGKLGALSAVTASLCCLGPAALAAIGLGGLAAGALFARLTWIFLGLATALLALGWRLYAMEAKRCQQAQCRMPGRSLSVSTLAAASLIVGAIAFMHLWPALNQFVCSVSCPR
jgi:hypothetical protein